MTQNAEPGRQPRGDLSIRNFAMPSDANHNGDIFGGWLLGQMDIAGGLFASRIACARTATVAIDSMTFKKPVFIGDVVSVYTELTRIGTTSIAVHIEAWVSRLNGDDHILVTEGNFTYVALDDSGHPRAVAAATGLAPHTAPLGRDAI
jgi:acyl-CoA thioesterase YciA